MANNFEYKIHVSIDQNGLKDQTKQALSDMAKEIKNNAFKIEFTGDWKDLVKQLADLQNKVPEIDVTRGIEFHLADAIKEDTELGKQLLSNLSTFVINSVKDMVTSVEGIKGAIAETSQSLDDLKKRRGELYDGKNITNATQAYEKAEQRFIDAETRLGKAGQDKTRAKAIQDMRDAYQDMANLQKEAGKDPKNSQTMQNMKARIEQQADQEFQVAKNTYVKLSDLYKQLFETKPTHNSYAEMLASIDNEILEKENRISKLNKDLEAAENPEIQVKGKLANDFIEDLQSQLDALTGIEVKVKPKIDKDVKLEVEVEGDVKPTKVSEQNANEIVSDTETAVKNFERLNNQVEKYRKAKADAHLADSDITTRYQEQGIDRISTLIRPSHETVRNNSTTQTGLKRKLDEYLSYKKAFETGTNKDDIPIKVSESLLNRTLDELAAYVYSFQDANKVVELFGEKNKEVFDLVQERIELSKKAAQGEQDSVPYMEGIKWMLEDYGIDKNKITSSIKVSLGEAIETGGMEAFATKVEELFGIKIPTTVEQAKASIQSVNEAVSTPPNTSGMDKVEEEHHEEAVAAQEAADAERNLAEARKQAEAKSKTVYRAYNRTAGIMGEEGMAWFSDNPETMKTYIAQNPDRNVVKGQVDTSKLFKLDAQGAKAAAITYLGDQSDEASKKITEVYNKIQALKKELAEKPSDALSEELKQLELEYDKLSEDESNMYGTRSSTQFALRAKEAGYKGIEISNVIDDYNMESGKTSTTIAIFDNDALRETEDITSQIKGNIETTQQTFNKASALKSYADAYQSEEYINNTDREDLEIYLDDLEKEKLLISEVGEANRLAGTSAHELGEELRKITTQTSEKDFDYKNLVGSDDYTQGIADVFNKKTGIGKYYDYLVQNTDFGTTEEEVSAAYEQIAQKIIDFQKEVNNIVRSKIESIIGGSNQDGIAVTESEPDINKVRDTLGSIMNQMNTSQITGRNLFDWIRENASEAEKELLSVSKGFEEFQKLLVGASFGSRGLFEYRDGAGLDIFNYNKDVTSEVFPSTESQSDTSKKYIYTEEQYKEAIEDTNRIIDKNKVKLDELIQKRDELAKTKGWDWDDEVNEMTFEIMDLVDFIKELEKSKLQLTDKLKQLESNGNESPSTDTTNESPSKPSSSKEPTYTKQQYQEELVETNRLIDINKTKLDELIQKRKELAKTEGWDNDEVEEMSLEIERLTNHIKELEKTKYQITDKLKHMISPLEREFGVQQETAKTSDAQAEAKLREQSFVENEARNNNLKQEKQLTEETAQVVKDLTQSYKESSDIAEQSSKERVLSIQKELDAQEEEYNRLVKKQEERYKSGDYDTTYDDIRIDNLAKSIRELRSEREQLISTIEAETKAKQEDAKATDDLNDADSKSADVNPSSGKNPPSRSSNKHHPISTQYRYMKLPDGSIVDISRGYTSEDQTGRKVTRTQQFDKDGNEIISVNQTTNYTKLVNDQAKAWVELAKARNKYNEEIGKSNTDQNAINELEKHVKSCEEEFKRATKSAHEFIKISEDYYNETGEGSKFTYADYKKDVLAKATPGLEKESYRHTSYYSDQFVKKQKRLNTISDTLGFEIENGNHIEEFNDELKKLKKDIDDLNSKPLDVITQNELNEADILDRKFAQIQKSGKLTANNKANENSVTKGLTKINKILSDNTRFAFRNSNVAEDLRTLQNEYKNFDLSKPQKEVDELNNRLLKVMANFEELPNTFKGKNLFQQIGEQVRSKISQLAAQYLSFQDLIRYARTAATTIVDLDTQLVDLRKTTSMTSTELEQFYNNSSNVAKQLGVTTSEIISQAAAWSRLGYSTKEAATEMAKLSSQFASISPGMDTEASTDYLVSSMQAFGISVDEVQRKIMDNINAIGNTMATSNSEIGEMLARSSAAMKAANNTIEETIALESAAKLIWLNVQQCA